MSFEIKKYYWWRVLVLCMVSWKQQQQHCGVNGEPQVPCLFIFGDSLSDSGNNNDLSTFARANYPPYGIDFPGGVPSGRFSNGRTMVDLLAEILGFDHYMPPFHTANVSDILAILQGVNYASGSAGIRNETGHHLGVCISFHQQVQNHKTIVPRIIKALGNTETAMDYLNKCLYFIDIGSNDYLNNYFMPEYYPKVKFYTLDGFAASLIRLYLRRIKELYNQGARKFVLVGLGQLGCIPHSVETYGTNGSICVDRMNIASIVFNKKLVSLVDELNNKMMDAKFIYINSYHMGGGNASEVGFKVVNSGCCKVREDGQCRPKGNACYNRSEYVFWDSFHPTEATNKITAERMYSAFEAADSYPFDISHLIQFNLEQLRSRTC